VRPVLSGAGRPRVRTSSVHDGVADAASSKRTSSRITLNVDWSVRCTYSLLLFFGSTLRQSRPNKAGLTCLSVHLSVRTSVCLSTKHFFDFSEIWRVGRGRWVMHDSMQYDPSQGQGQGREPFKVGNPAIFKSYFLCHLQWELEQATKS